MWPKQVKLIQRYGFTEIKEGVAVGIIGAPAGTVIDLIQVKGSRLVVSYMSNKAEIDANITDIGDRVDINAIIAAPIPASPAATNSPPVTQGASSPGAGAAGTP